MVIKLEAGATVLYKRLNEVFKGRKQDERSEFKRLSLKTTVVCSRKPMRSKLRSIQTDETAGVEKTTLRSDCK